MSLREPISDLTELTLKDSTDIDLQIANCRRELAWKRSASRAKGVFARNPRLGKMAAAFENVVETLLEEMGQLTITSGPDLWQEDDVKTREKDLKNLCLVHRSLTPIAQRALRRRIIVGSQSDLRRLLCSPFCGPWIRELVLYWDLGSLAYVNENRQFLSEVLDMLSTLFSRAPNICTFSLRTGYSRRWQYDGIEPLLSSLTQLSSLRTLFLTHDDYDRSRPGAYPSVDSESSTSCPLLGLVCRTIPKLQHLTSLSIRNWGFDEDEEYPNPPEVMEVGPPPQLTSLEFDPSTAYLTVVNLGRVLRSLVPPRPSDDPRASPFRLLARLQHKHVNHMMMRSLKGILKDGVDNLHICSAMDPADLKHLTDISASLKILVPSKQDKAIRDWGLRKLYLVLRVQTTFMRLPPSIEELHLHVHFDRAPKRVILDTKVHAILSNNSLPRLKALTITVSSDGRPAVKFRDGSEVRCARLELVDDFCEEEDVALSCYPAEFPPWAKWE